MLHGRAEDGVVEELSTFDGLCNSYQVLIDYAAGSDIQVTNFGVPHLARRKADFLTRAKQQTPGIFSRQAIVYRSACERYGALLLLYDLRWIGVVTPSITDNQDYGCPGHVDSELEMVLSEVVCGNRYRRHTLNYSLDMIRC
jgi:hypothetical protein